MREVNEAEFWLRSAKELFSADEQIPEKYTVVVAQCIHSIIRANDALTLKFLGKRAVKHKEAIDLFLDLIKFNKIPSKFADLRKVILQPAIETKSKVDYKGLFVSKAEAERWIRLSEKFLNCTKECLKK
jgi:uncharacterized protein (UPF0332 family)